MPKLLRTHPAIRPGLDHWLTHDRRFAASGLTIDDVTARMDRDLTLASLAETIVGQQLSVKAAATIWGRVVAALDVTDPRAWIAAATDDLRALGLSAAKTNYAKGLAAAVADGMLDLPALKRAPDDQVIAALTAQKGFGVWSAQMILIFTLGRPKVWPAGDLGIQEGLRLYRRLPNRPTPKETETYGQKKFAPHPSAAALLLWRLKDRAPPPKP
jgi:DNA-3-methyladenine glycosylase II